MAVLEIAEAFAQRRDEAEALDPLRLARRRREGALGLGVLHRPSDRAARFDRRAAQHGHGRPRRRRTTSKGGGPGYLQLVGSRRLSTELGDLVEAVAKTEPTPFKFDYSYDANGHPQQYYCRSDHYEYARYGIPIAFFTTGGHRDYHQVTDEPQYIDYDQLARVAKLVHDVAIRVAEPRPSGRGRQAEAGSRRGSVVQ